MIAPDSLIDFVRMERDAEVEERRSRDLLSTETLVQQGDALEGLTTKRSRQGEVWMACPINESRLRPGTRLILECGGTRLRADLVDLEDAGLTLRLRLPKGQAPPAGGPWFAAEAAIDLSPLLIQSLKKLQPGAPGWSFFRAISGDTPPREYPRRNADGKTLDALIGRVLEDASIPIDASQEQAITACVVQPSMLAVQGPPGTGKTLVLALVAEALARLGRRVLLTAPTHQAVNNSLATLHRVFPARTAFKVGDELRRESLPDAIECKSPKEATRSITGRGGGEPIVGMTYLSALQNLAVRSSGLAPNVVLIDEAGQLPLAQGACAGLIGAGSVLMFGDDAQMPPVFPSNLADDRRATSVFRRLRQVRPGSIRMLSTTYRLNDELCGVISGGFYPDADPPLHPSPGSSSRRLILPKGLGHAAGTLIDAVLGCPSSFVWVRTGGSNARQSNPTEARFIADLVSAALRGGLTPDQVAVVTPFRRHAARVRATILEGSGVGADAVPIVDTVERVQGLTVELVAISLCTSSPEYAGEVGGFLFSPNRLNVSMSRARSKVVLAASPNLLGVIPTDYTGLVASRAFSSILGRAGASFDIMA